MFQKRSSLIGSDNTVPNINDLNVLALAPAFEASGSVERQRLENSASNAHDRLALEDASEVVTRPKAEGARLEIDSGRALQRTAKRNNALPIHDFRNNDVHRSVPVNDPV